MSTDLKIDAPVPPPPDIHRDVTLAAVGLPEPAVKWLRDALHKVSDGWGRNDAGFWLAAQLRDDGLTEAEATAVMETFVCVVPPANHPYSSWEALTTLRSAYQKPPRDRAAIADMMYDAPHIKRVREWPQLSDAALSGLPGDVTRAILPHSEADPAALLVQFLAMFGNVIGRHAHWIAEADEHYGNLFVMLVGRSSKARKGTSLGQVRRLFTSADAEWVDNRTSGLSSGEGLIYSVRDALTKKKRMRGENKSTEEYEEVLEDPGVADKRLLVVQSEFASVLKAMMREGNTLSAVLREAWDSGHLRTMTKNSPLTATDAHVSTIGHITQHDLKAYLKNTDAGNGFANRFLWICTERSKSLPDGSMMPRETLHELSGRVASAIGFSKQIGVVVRDHEAGHLWRDVYEALSSGHPGLFGMVTGRAEAQVMRLAMLYALCDHSSVILKRHLEAALGLWEYAEASARYIFGDALGNKLADRLLAELTARPDGLTRTAMIRDVFRNNVKSSDLEGALELLYELHLAFPISSDTSGRAVETWFSFA